jgi:hypothetical protein
LKGTEVLSLGSPAPAPVTTTKHDNQTVCKETPPCKRNPYP